MKKVDLDWNRLSFSYTKTPLRFVSRFREGSWDEGELTEDGTVVLHESAGVLQYAQSCFEGLKAYTSKSGKIVCFRPDLNAQRMAESAARLEMPVYPEDKFLEAVKKTLPQTSSSCRPTAAALRCICALLCSPRARCSASSPRAEYEFRILRRPSVPISKAGSSPLRSAFRI